MEINYEIYTWFKNKDSYGSAFRSIVCVVGGSIVYIVGGRTGGATSAIVLIYTSVCCVKRFLFCK